MKPQETKAAMAFGSGASTVLGCISIINSEWWITMLFFAFAIYGFWYAWGR